MELKEMSVEQLEARKAELLAEIDKEGADLDAIDTEARAIKEEIEARRDEAAKKAEIRKAVANGEGKVTKSFNEEKRKMFEVNSVEYRNAWLKSLQGKELTAEERAGYTQSSTYATNAIPTIVADKFFEKMKKLAPMMNHITLMRVAGNLKFVAQDTNNAAAVHTENSALTPAADTTVSVTLGAKEFVKLIGISKSAAMMSIDAFEDWLVEVISGDLARAIDNYIVNSAIAAITYTTGTNQIVNTQAWTRGNINSLIALLPAAYDAEATFLMNKATLYNKVAGILDSVGRPYFVENHEDGFAGRLMGYPVLIDDYVTTANDAVYLGRWAGVVGNLSEGPEVERSAEAGFASATILYRGYASFDAAVAQSDAVVRLVSTT